MKYIPELFPNGTGDNFINLYPGQDKSLIPMYKGIQIDDNFNNLIGTNAHIKVLLTNNIVADFNKGYATKNNNADELLLNDNLYYANDLNEVYEILKFNVEHPYDF